MAYPVAAVRNKGSLPSLSPVSGMSLWVDFDDITTLFQDTAGTSPVTADGQQIGKALDKSGNGNHVTRTPSAALIYKSNIQNGKGVGRYNVQSLLSASIQAVGADGTWTCFAVCDPSSYSSIRGIAGQDGTGTRVFQFRYTTSGYIEVIAFNSTGTPFTATGSTEISTFAIAVAKRGATSIQAWLNGNATASVGTTGTPASTSRPFAVGATNDTNGLPMAGDIGELIFYPSALSDAGMITVQDYLKVKWGLTF